MPILTFDSKDAIPDGLREDAKEVAEGEQKGKWAVNVVPKAKLDEFRTNNTSLAQGKETAESLLKQVLEVAGGKVEDFKLDEFKALQQQMRDTAQQVADGKLKTSTDIEAEVTKRTEAMRTKHDDTVQQLQRQISAEKARADENDGKFRRTFIDKAVVQASSDDTLGVEPMAVSDIITKAYTLFQVETDGKLVPKREGQTVWGEDGATPMTVKEWLDKELRKEAPYFFKRSSGGGAAGGGSGGGAGGYTPEQLSKMSPEERLRIANRESVKTGRK